MVTVYGVLNFICLAVWLIPVFQYGAHSVSITDLRVPPLVKNGTNNAAILDCQYSLRPEEQSPDSGLVVKWFFNKSPNPVYQWIHNQKPQGLGILKGRLWLDYKASENNDSAYRALYIVNPTVELSGEYKCQVSTNTDEDFSLKRMLVWAPEKKLEVFHIRYNSEKINITCRAFGVYPEPEITLYNETTQLEEVTVLSKKRRDAFDVLAFAVIPDTELASPAAISCSLRIPGTNYFKSKTMYYYPGSTESLSSVSGCASEERMIKFGSLLLLTALLIK